jgi:hypothetical protein
MAALLLGLGGPGLGAQSREIVDRTLAIVSGRVITLADLRTAVTLGLVEGEAASALERLIDRELVLREVDRYAPPEPPDAAIDARLEEIAARVASPDALGRVLADGGFTDLRLRGWVRDDLRIAAYLGQRFAAAGQPTDQDVAAAYARDREQYERAGTTFEAAAPLIRQRLSVERRRDLIADWLADLRRRADITRIEPLGDRSIIPPHP